MPEFDGLQLQDEDSAEEAIEEARQNPHELSWKQHDDLPEFTGFEGLDEFVKRQEKEDTSVEMSPAEWLMSLPSPPSRVQEPKQKADTSVEMSNTEWLNSIPSPPSRVQEPKQKPKTQPELPLAIQVQQPQPTPLLTKEQKKYAKGLAKALAHYERKERKAQNPKSIFTRIVETPSKLWNAIAGPKKEDKAKRSQIVGDVKPNPEHNCKFLAILLQTSHLNPDHLVFENFAPSAEALILKNLENAGVIKGKNSHDEAIPVASPELTAVLATDPEFSCNGFALLEKENDLFAQSTAPPVERRSSKSHFCECWHTNFIEYLLVFETVKAAGLEGLLADDPPVETNKYESPLNQKHLENPVEEKISNSNVGYISPKATNDSWSNTRSNVLMYC